MNRLFRLGRCLILMILFGNSVQRIDAQHFPDSMDWGRYRAGFQSKIVHDFARTYRIRFEDGGEYGRQGKLPRPILINIWYPTSKQHFGVHFKYREYFQLVSEDPPTQEWANHLSSYAQDVVSTEYFGKNVNELDEFELDQWNRFLNTPTRAVKDADPEPGSFPVVIYHSGAGSSYEDNSVFCEFLASHGYIVIGSAYPSADGTSFGIDANEGSVRDMEFLVRYAKSLENADWNRVIFAGHSAGAQTSLRAATRPDCPASALVLLDTTVDYYSLHIPTFKYITELAVEKSEFITQKMLVTTGHGALFQMCDKLIQSDRTYLLVPELGHNEFIAQGVWRLQVIQWMNDTQPKDELAKELKRIASVNYNYVQLCHYTLDYLNAIWSDESPDTRLNQVSNSQLDRNLFAIERVELGNSVPEPWDPESGQPPTPRQLIPSIDALGVEPFGQLLEKFHRTHPDAAIFESNMLMCSVLCELMHQGRIEDARHLHKIAKPLRSNGVSTLRFLAFMAQLGKKTEWELDYLQMALIIDPKDKETVKKMDELEQRISESPPKH